MADDLPKQRAILRAQWLRHGACLSDWAPAQPVQEILERTELAWIERWGGVKRQEGTPAPGFEGGFHDRQLRFCIAVQDPGSYVCSFDTLGLRNSASTRNVNCKRKIGELIIRYTSHVTQYLTAPRT